MKSHRSLHFDQNCCTGSRTLRNHCRFIFLITESRNATETVIENHYFKPAQLSLNDARLHAHKEAALILDVILTKWLRRHTVHVLDCSVCSPDLFCVENIWYIIKRRNNHDY
ncbi:hypothetical protein GOODEAATRI_005248 [Goodea atripinnis]|uniref:Uncharacterized protein n=1 Tax=Goodea atripinnis TaxID=208336 RepID=A0ABV0MYV6_9TELE